MRRGDLWWINLEQVVGAESSTLRPGVVVSNDGANGAAWRRRRGVVTVVPLTTSVARVFPFQVLIESPTAGLATPSKAQAEQARAIDVARFVERIGTVSQAELRAIDDALRLHLALT